MKSKFRLILQRTLVLLAAVSAAVVCCPFVAGAQEFDVGDHPAAFIDRFDQDGDGLVSSDEFPGPEPIFDELDSDGDGYLSTAEAPTEPPPHDRPPRDLLAALDTDGDGLISIAEFDADEMLFDDLDQDGDGYLSQTELLSGAHHPPRRPDF